jgi:hypothetical protein
MYRVETRPGPKPQPELPGYEMCVSPQPPIVGRVFPSGTERFFLQQGAKETSMPVSAVYPVTEDLRFLRDNEARMSPAQKEYYLRENIIAFVEEFAGQIPIKRTKGLILPDELQIGGFDMLVAARKAVTYKQRAGLDNSRERAELVGLEKMHQMFQEKNEQGAVWVSASKIANYLMLFGLEVGEYDDRLGGRPFTEYILRRDEQMEKTDVSMKYHQELSRLSGQEPSTEITSAEDMLHRPIPFGKSLNMKSLSNLAGITEEEIQYAEDFGKEARIFLSPLINRYIELVERYDLLDVDDQNQRQVRERFKQEAQPLVNAMYSAGVRLRKYLNGELSNNENNIMSLVLQGTKSIQAPDTKAEFLISYMKNLPQEVIEGGSQCPSWTTGSKTADVMGALIGSGFGITESRRIMMGLGKDNIVYVNGVKHLLCECPESGCSSRNPKRKVLAPIEHDRITCPCCHASAPYKC